MVRARREQLGLTQPEVARRGGLSVQDLSNIETGQRGVGMKRLPRLAKALDVELKYFLGDDGDALVRTGRSTPLRLIQHHVEKLGYVGAGYDTITWRQNLGTVEILTDHHLKPGTFALEVRGDSMRPLLLPKSEIVIEPISDQRSAVFDRIVVAENTREEIATVKLLERLGRERVLTPLNPKVADPIAMTPDWKLTGYVIHIKLPRPSRA